MRVSRFIVVKRAKGYFIELIVSRPEEPPRVTRQWGPYNKRVQAVRDLDSGAFFEIPPARSAHR